MERRVAFVTGASRGIGRCAAVALARVGYDVVVTARTRKEGQSADGRPLPGSIETTARQVREEGREALEIFLDLLEPKTIQVALDRVRAEWGSIELLLNNGIYTGPASMERFLDLEIETIETLFRANFFSQIDLTRRVLPEMLDRNRGCIINMVSGAGVQDPPAPAGEGGWGFAYAASKAALHRMVGVLRVEHAASAVRFFNVEPGFVMTEAMKLNDPRGELTKRLRPAPPTVPAAVIAWLASSTEAAEWNGKTVLAQRLCLDRGLHPDWR